VTSVTDPEHGEAEAERAVLKGLRWALALTGAILVIEAIGAFLSRSLSVTVDAVHNVPDLFAFAVSWAALRATERGASEQLTFGAHRFEVFAGLLNGALVLGTGAVFGYEALVTLVRGGSFAGAVDPVWIILVAIPTLALRTTNLAILGRVPRRARDLNLHSVVVHLGSDLMITGALLADGFLLLFRPSLGPVDAVVALVIAAILVYESLPLFRDGTDVLTERMPRNLSLAAIESSAGRVPRVVALHDVHVWAVCPTLVCMTAHVEVEEMSVHEVMKVVAELRGRMQREFGILHSTFEVETPASDRPPTRADPRTVAS
jgi:cobalt-zinc-cadmium efflux system protein